MGNVFIVITIFGMMFLSCAIPWILVTVELYIQMVLNG